MIKEIYVNYKLNANFTNYFCLFVDFFDFALKKSREKLNSDKKKGENTRRKRLKEPYIFDI